MSNITEALDRLPMQFNESVNLKSIITSIVSDIEDEDAAFTDLLNNRYIDTATGVQLDLIGEIVGVSRPADIDLTGFFGFEGDLTALGWGLVADPTVGGRWRLLTDSPTSVSDDLYRRVIKVKASINSTAMTAPQTVESIAFALNAKVKYIQSPDTSFYPVYEVQKIMDESDREIIKTFPVLIAGSEPIYSQALPDFFGFEGDDDALGFADSGDTSIGGYMSSTV